MDLDARPLLMVGPLPASDVPPVFDRIGIIGLGLIGGSIAAAARQLWPSSLVIGVDRNEILEQAVARHAVDVAASDLTIISEADVVFLAAPVLTNVQLLSQLADYIEKPTIVTDVSSTKRAIVEASRALPANLIFVGGHPLAGAARGGIGAARADLFVGRPWFLTPSADEQAAGGGNGEAGDPATTTPLARLTRFVQALGARPRTIDAAAHDHLVALLSHLPQLAATALMETIGDHAGADGLQLAGRGLQDTTRLAASPADIWTDICATNADEISASLDQFIAILTNLRKNLGDSATIATHFENANKWRAELTKGR